MYIRKAVKKILLIKDSLRDQDELRQFVLVSGVEFLCKDPGVGDRAYMHII